jgi:hypothetical protein
MGDASGLFLIGYIQFTGADVLGTVARRNSSVFVNGVGDYVIRFGPPEVVSFIAAVPGPALNATSKWQRTVGQVLPKVTIGDVTVPANDGRVTSVTQVDLQTYRVQTFTDAAVAVHSIVWFGLFQLRP